MRKFSLISKTMPFGGWEQNYSVTPQRLLKVILGHKGNKAALALPCIQLSKTLKSKAKSTDGWAGVGYLVEQ